MLKKFLTNKRGNFALMFAAVSFPLLAVVGMTLEYSNLSKHKAKLQNAVDSAALFAGKQYLATNTLPSSANIASFIEANFDGDVKNVNTNVVGDKLVTTAGSKAPAFFFGTLMPSVFEQTADASIPVGNKSYIEIAMVLDTTYSMGSDNKLVDLKTVANDFITKMDAATNANTTIKMGVVPFANHVNVGMSNRNASWIDVPLDKTETKNICSSAYPAGTDMTCTSGTGSADGVEYETNHCVPTDSSVSPVTTCADKVVETKWFGCVGSRDTPYTLVDGLYATRMPGLISTSSWHCPSALTPLTDQMSTLKTGINGLVARGDTYMAPGVMWGLRLLSSQMPFSEAKDLGSLPSTTVHKKIMIVMTDGDNTKSPSLPWDHANWGTDVVEANDFTKTACKAARDENITVYSIAFGTTVSADGKAVMLDCAGVASQYFPAADAKALKEAFDSIGSKILALRLSS